MESFWVALPPHWDPVGGDSSLQLLSKEARELWGLGGHPHVPWAEGEQRLS
jgi:hypothetical protein